MNAGIFETFQYLIKRQVPAYFSSVFFLRDPLGINYLQVVPAGKLSHDLRQALVVEIKHSILPGNILVHVGGLYLTMRKGLSGLKEYLVHLYGTFQQTGFDMVFVCIRIDIKMSSKHLDLLVTGSYVEVLVLILCPFKVYFAGNFYFSCISRESGGIGDG